MYKELFELYKNDYFDLAKDVFEEKQNKYSGSDIKAYQFIVPFLHLNYRVNSFSLEELSTIITDCTQDGGIDGFYFGKQYIDIFEFKSNKGIIDVELDRIMTSIDKYLLRHENNFIGDESIKENILKLRKHKNRKLRLILVREKHFYSKQELKEGKKGNKKILSIIEKIESYGIEVLFKDVESLFLDNFDVDTITGKIVLGIESDLLAKNQQGSKDIVARITVKTLLDEFIEKYGTKIINSNVRGHLNKRKFSEKIIETLKNDPEKFWIFHNGITITCSNLQPVTPNPNTITLDNPQIVNGGQTLFGLHIAHRNGYIKDEHLKKASIVCKIIEAESKKMVNKICETSNTQNAVKADDLMSNEEINIFLEQYLAKTSNGKVFYKRKKGTKVNNPVTSAELFQWVCAAMLKLPTFAKNEKQFLFDVVTKKGKFYDIEGTIKKELVKVLPLCEIAISVKNTIKKEKNKNKKSMLEHMDMHIIAGMFIKGKFEKKLFNEIYSFLINYYKTQIKLDKNKNPNKVFTKDTDTWKELEKYIAQI